MAMRELNIEEKAKRYDKALERAKGLVDFCSDNELKTLEFVFPELKESEDEKIRQFLIHEVTETSDKVMSYRNMNKEDVLAWLEKQGEQNVLQTPTRETILAVWELGNIWKELTHGVCFTEYGTQLNYIQKHWKESDYYLKAKQGEQKPLIIPKFRVGDIITPNGKKEYYTITDIVDGWYKFKEKHVNGGIPIHYQFGWELVEQKPADKVEPLQIKGGNWYVCIKDYQFCEHDYLTFEKGKIYNSVKDGEIIAEDGGKWPFGDAKDYFRIASQEEINSMIKFADKVEHLIPQKGVYYVCIKDYYLADGNTTHTKDKIYKSSCDGYINDDKGFGLSWINSCTENYFRPIKEEDWIVCEQNNVIDKPFQYKEFMSELIQKNIKSLEDKGIVPNLRLWDITKDAKDGDVLYSPCCKLLWIYKDGNSCYIGNNLNYNENCVVVNSPICIPTDAIPATKEQRELLFAKMHEAGYEWDAEKKELKKIENEIEISFGAKDSELQEATYYIPKGFHAEIEGNNVIIKKGEQKPANRVEPKFKVGDIISNGTSEVKIIEVNDNSYSVTNDEIENDCNLSNWVVYFKNQDNWKLVEQKSYWGKEDERIYMSIMYSFAHNYPLTIQQQEFVKSLQDKVQQQNTWKPSDEQMKVLNEVLNFAANHESSYWNDYIFGTLHNLIRQLKNLKGE